LQSLSIDGEVRRAPPRLLHAGVHLKDPATEWAADITRRVLLGLAEALASGLAATTGGMGRAFFSVKPRHAVPSVRNTSRAGNRRLLKPIKLQAYGFVWSQLTAK
jgi:hypothetical protein